ncbi:unnamed protein product [Dracunculus medinensis]|uniref:Uncharacterized protein n=1 Tax=Dracunculus medinensis TaxID=318479 RepID=A0A0N4UHS4_DRAME|nr:unnamed protein product [Dracunculus medinensis]
MFKSFGLELGEQLVANSPKIFYITFVKKYDTNIGLTICENTTSINTVITERRLRWLGHVLRRPSQELTHISLLAKPCDGWHQKRDGPIKIWSDTVRKDFERIAGPSIYGLR